MATLDGGHSENQLFLTAKCKKAEAIEDLKSPKILEQVEKTTPFYSKSGVPTTRNLSEFFSPVQ